MTDPKDTPVELALPVPFVDAVAESLEAAGITLTETAGRQPHVVLTGEQAKAVAAVAADTQAKAFKTTTGTAPTSDDHKAAVALRRACTTVLSRLATMGVAAPADTKETNTMTTTTAADKKPQAATAKKSASPTAKRPAQGKAATPTPPKGDEPTSRHPEIAQFGFSVHPKADRYALLPDDEMAALAASIESEGLLEPVEVDGTTIIDGRNRWIAHVRLTGKKPRTKQWKGSDVGRHIMARNLERRHLSVGQRVMAGYAMLDGKVDKEARLNIMTKVGTNSPAWLSYAKKVWNYDRAKPGAGWVDAVIEGRVQLKAAHDQIVAEMEAAAAAKAAVEAGVKGDEGTPVVSTVETASPPVKADDAIAVKKLAGHLDKVTPLIDTVKVGNLGKAELTKLRDAVYAEHDRLGILLAELDDALAPAPTTAKPAAKKATSTKPASAKGSAAKTTPAKPAGTKIPAARKANTK